MIELNLQEIVLVSPDELKPNAWNPNSVGIENMEKLKASLATNGFFKPVLVRETDEGLEIIGGQHRIEAARELGIEVPTINLGEISDAQAKKFTLMDNDSYGENDSILLSRVLKDLSAAGEDILGEMTYSEEELSDLADLTTKVDLDALDDLDDLDLDLEAPPPEPPLKTEKDEQQVKTIKIKVDITKAEEFEDSINALCEEFGIEDSDLAVMRGDLLARLVGEARE